MTAPKLSAAALARCRSMTIEYHEDGVRRTIRVYDPRYRRKVMATSTVRTPQDLKRFKDAWMRLYRVPVENITEIKVEVTQSEDENDANETDKVAPAVHEHREEVLGSNSGGDDGPPKVMPTVVPRQARRSDQ